MLSAQPDHASLSETEVAEAIRGLTTAGWNRLNKIARFYACNCAQEPDDLLQEAFTRAIAGSRRCPRHVDPIRFLAEAMRSIASDGKKAAQRQEKTHANANYAGLRLVVSTPNADAVADDAPTPEEEVASEEAAAKSKAAILSLFADDLMAQTIVEGRMEEMEADDIRAVTGLEMIAYASKCRLIRRRIEQAYPKGRRP